MLIMIWHGVTVGHAESPATRKISAPGPGGGTPACHESLTVPGNLMAPAPAAGPGQAARERVSLTRDSGNLMSAPARFSAGSETVAARGAGPKSRESAT